jgi:glutamyl-Q tRNA(Asp) synthetase
MSVVTRFAPSPTGPLHLGHAWSALVAHDAARERGGRFLLRIDDIDPGRVRAHFRDAIDQDLAWLGLVPDGEPLVQSQRFPAYRAALERLAGGGLAYPCFCTRAEIAAEIAASAAAPHGPDGPVYPGTCRSLAPAVAAARVTDGEPHAWRLDMGEALRRTGALVWHDADGRAVTADPAPFGDVVLARRDAPASYHLASTLDDAAMAVTLAVRGEDLFAATHIHRLLQALLDLPSPAYLHHRLIGDADGRRLAKRHDAASIASLRAAGTDPHALVTDLRTGRLPLGYRWVAP